MATGLYERYYSYRLNGPCRMYRLQGKVRSNGHCRAKPTSQSATPQILTQTRQFTLLSKAAQWFTQESMCRSGRGQVEAMEGNRVAGKAMVRAGRMRARELRARELRARELRASELRASEFDVARFLGNGRRTRMDSGIPAWILLPYILLPAIRLPPQKPPPGNALPAFLRTPQATVRDSNRVASGSVDDHIN